MVIAPDGEIGAIPLEVLSDGRDGHLIDDFRFRYVGCAADLALEPAPSDPEPQPSVVMAAPDYGTPQPFRALDGAREEGELVAARLGVEAVTGARATKARLQEVDRPRILHLATHGFYLPSHTYDLFDLTGSTAYIAAEDLKQGRLSGERVRDPYLRSGLALAGANAWAGSGEPSADAGTGLMTAADVRRMRLPGTRLVVLSACETALGQAKNLEGMIGLRQAFLAAGARALISSVWLVPDRRTATFFATFYDHLLAGEMTDEALRRTQLETRRTRKHPRFWGGFVHYGVTPARLSPVPNAHDSPLTGRSSGSAA
jgi:CHAT domain-containing protein